MFSDVSGCEARLLTELDHINTPADVFSAFHHPRGRKHAPTFVEQPIGNSCDPDMSRDWPKRTITRWISINPEEVHKSGRVLSLGHQKKTSSEFCLHSETFPSAEGGKYLLGEHERTRCDTPALHSISLSAETFHLSWNDCEGSELAGWKLLVGLN